MKTPSGLSVGASILLLFASAQGATNSVTSLADNGAGSLRSAVLQSLPGDFILFAINGTIGLTNGEILITKNLNIIGTGPTNLAISASNRSRIFSVTSGVSVAIANLTLRDGHTPDGTNGTNANPFPFGVMGGSGGASQPGGAVVNMGVLSFTNCQLISNGTGVGGSGGSGAVGGQGGNGASSGNGGAIYNVGTLLLHRCVLSGNTTGASGTGGASGETHGIAGMFAGRGGAIFNQGTSMVNQCTISDNSTGAGGAGGQGGWGGDGGGFYNGGNSWLINSTVSGNVAGNGGTATEFASGGVGGFGGGLYNQGACAVTNCTFEGNRSGDGGAATGFSFFPGSAGDGGGVYAGNTFLACNTTFSRNVAGEGGRRGVFPSDPQLPPGRGGGIYGSSATLFNSLVTSNYSLSNFSFYALTDVSGTFTSSGNNLVSVTNDSTGFNHATDLRGSLASPLLARLGPLAANGGPTMTCALLQGSPAIDAGGSTITSTDQRGFLRASGPGVDIGAFEVQVPSGPPRLAGLAASNGLFRFSFTNRPGAIFTVLGSTNVALPSSNWPSLGPATETTPGQFQFSDPTTSNRHRFYRVRSP